jgi:small-conductance mechanosensitive channel
VFDFLRRIILLALLLAAGPAFAQGAASPAAPAQQSKEQILDQARATLDEVNGALARTDLSDAKLIELRAKLIPLTPALIGTIEDLQPRLAGFEKRLDELGPKPKDMPESPAIATERADQDKGKSDIEAMLKRAKVLLGQLDQTSTDIAMRRRALFTRALFNRASSILHPGLWADVLGELPQNVRIFEFTLADWAATTNNQLSDWRRPAFWGLIGFIIIIYWPVLRISRKVVWRDPGNEHPGELRKVLAAIWIAIVTALLPIAALVVIGAVFSAFNIYDYRLQPLAHAIFSGVGRIALTLGLAKGLLAPHRPNWRMVDLGDRVSRRIYNLAIWIAVLVSVTKLGEAINDIVGASLSFSMAMRGIGALLVALVMAFSLHGLVAPLFDEETGEPIPETNRAIFAPMRIATWSAIIGILIAVVVGYQALASFIVDQIVWISGVGSILYLLLCLIDEAFEVGFKPGAPAARVLMNSIGVSRESLGQIGTLLGGLLHLGVYGAAVVLVLAPWGIRSDDFAGSLQAAFFGLQVGNVTISLSTILSAIALFAIGYGITRAIQGWLENRYLPQTQLDLGLRNSIRTSVGYIGFFAAFVTSATHLGLNFERLELIAGALSVGIGLGLQSIVSNFFSGLILLWERTIRVGDWVVLGQEQGYVRRINVRATEIETFDRATVIIPNSNLISGIVKNWVRGDRMGRIKMTITVGHETDPERLREIMTEVAKQQDLVLPLPVPQLMFTEMSPAGLTFELLCFIADVETSYRAKSDLHYAAYKRLREEGITIPQAAAAPIVNFNGLEKLEALLAQPRKTSL